HSLEQLAASGAQPSVLEQSARGELVDDVGGVGEVRAVAHSEGELVAIHGVVEHRRHAQCDPLRLRELGLDEVARQGRVEGLLGLADELRAEGSGHGDLLQIRWYGQRYQIVGTTNKLSYTAAMPLERVATRPTWLLSQANARAQALLAECFA